jgi:hypothetical protein
MRTNHFEYLTADDEANFFQKAAIDASGVRADQRPLRPRGQAMTKTASAAPFAKVAGRLDRDLEILKVAGDCGLNAGMVKRADAYLDVLRAHAGLSAIEFGEVFDMVKGAAIDIDLRAAHGQLCHDLPEDLHPIVDEVLIKVGAEMVRLAMLEKQSGLGSWIAKGVGRAAAGAETGALRRGLSAAGEVGAGAANAVGHVGEAIGEGMGTAAKNVGRAGRGVAEAVAAPGEAAGEAMGRGVKAVGQKATDLGNTARAAGRAEIMGAPEKLQSKLDSLKQHISSGGSALREPFAKSRAASLEKAIPKAQAARTGVAAREASTSTNPTVGGLKDIKGKDLGSAPRMPKRTGPDIGKTPSSEPEAAPGTSSGGAAAAAAAKEPEPIKPPKANGKPVGTPADEKEPSSPATPKPAGGTEPPGGAAGKPPGFMDAWKKATTSGWKSLNPDERSKLITGGVTAAMTYRAVTGKGAITGGEGII